MMKLVNRQNSPRSIQDLHIPSPMPLTWNGTRPHDILPDLDNSHLELVPSGLYDTIDSKHASINCNDDSITRTLIQYNQHKDVRRYSDIVTHGFIRIHTKTIASIIPTDIAHLCLSFYFEESNDCIHFAYHLYKLIHENNPKANINCVDGKRILSLITSNALDMKYAKDIDQALKDLVQYKFLRVVSYTTHFSTLWHALNAKPNCLRMDANDPNHCRYAFVMDVATAFESALLDETDV
eukprot:241414_1